MLFPTPNESSFRSLTCLLAKPQEGNDAALASCLETDPLLRMPQKRTLRWRLPVTLRISDCVNQLLVYSGWTPTSLSEPERSRFGVELWCQSFRKDFTLLFLLPCPCVPPSLQYFPDCPFPTAPLPASQHSRHLTCTP